MSTPIRYSPFHRDFLTHLMNDCSDKNISIPQLAKIIEVSPASVYSWIHEDYFPIPKNYNKLANFFGWPKFMKGERQ